MFDLDARYVMDKILNELLIVKSQKGDSNAYAELVSKWQEPLWYFVYRYCCSQTIAWNIITETWNTITKQLHQISDPADFSDWIFQTAYQKCGDWLNKQQLPTNFPGEYADAAESLLTDEYDENENPLDIAIRELRHDRRALIALYYHPDFDVARIGRIFDISEQSVNSRVQQAISELKLKMERFGDE